jgi:hypothetical protein
LTGPAENWAFELVVYVDRPRTDSASLQMHHELLEAVGDGFVIYSTDFLGTVRPINRMVKFAAGETVLVVPGGGAGGGDLGGDLVRTGWVEAAAHAFTLNRVRLYKIFL